MPGWVLAIALLLLAVPLQAGNEESCVVAVAALSLPDPDRPLLHWSSGGKPSRPLEVNTRSFSGRVTLHGDVMNFHQEPVAAPSAGEAGPDPLVSVKIPEGARMVYVVLFEEQDDEGKDHWRGVVIDSEDWETGSIRVFNAMHEPLGFDAGDKTFELAPEEYVDVHAHEWTSPFPVKFYRVRPVEKLLFASTWRVVAGRREVCFLSKRGRAVSLKSILDPAIPPTNRVP